MEINLSRGKTEAIKPGELMEYLKGFSENSSIAVLVVDEASRKLISVKDVIFVTDSEIPTLFVVQDGESEDMDSD